MGDADASSVGREVLRRKENGQADSTGGAIVRCLRLAGSPGQASCAGPLVQHARLAACPYLGRLPALPDTSANHTVAGGPGT